MDRQTVDALLLVFAPVGFDALRPFAPGRVEQFPAIPLVCVHRHGGATRGLYRIDCADDDLPVNITRCPPVEFIQSGPDSAHESETGAQRVGRLMAAPVHTEQQADRNNALGRGNTVGSPGADETTLRYVEGDGPRLAYELREPRNSPSAPGLPTLLCIHGNTSHRGVWYPAAGQLADYRIVLLDLRGHGDSDHVEPLAYNAKDHSADLARTVRKLELSRYVLVGHSNGALIAARFMRLLTQDDEISRPSAFIWLDMDPLVPDWQVQYFRNRGSAGRVFATSETVMKGIRRLYPQIPEEPLRAFVKKGLRPAEGGWRMKFDPATCAHWDPGDSREDLPSIGCPTLVLRGVDSMVSSEEGLAELEAGLADVETRSLPGSHMLLLEHPREVAEAMDEFLRRRAAADT